MSATPPVFGPTDTIPADENATPLAVAAIAITVTREQLRTALAAGHAEMAGQPPLDDISVLDVRREIEGHLAAGAIVSVDDETPTVTERLTPEYTAQLDAAIDRAYTRPPAFPRIPQDPQYGHGTVTLKTLDQGDVTTAEPAWCRGHDDEIVGRLADITHYGAAVTADAVTTRDGRTCIMAAQITQAPHGRHPEKLPLMSIRVDVDTLATTEDARNISQALRIAAIRLDRATADLAHLRGEQR
ncbi:DUF6907 domain-containing protein [Streptomyces tendae]|uniref:DUF6907 domain-containing protein n=1 Tax=Streptomyces tendae TaxID=1932 RepID=UPI003D724656